MAYACSHCGYQFQPLEEEVTGPFCDCPRCGGLSVREEVKSAGKPAAAKAPARRGASPAPRAADPFDTPDDNDEFSGMTGAIPLTPGLFDGYFQEAAAKPQALEEPGELPPFDQAEDWGIEAGDIHREPTMLLDEVAEQPPAPQRRLVPAEVSALRGAVDDAADDPFAVDVDIDEADAKFNDRTLAVDNHLYQQYVVEESVREQPPTDIHDESTRLANDPGQSLRRAADDDNAAALPRPPGGSAARMRVPTAEARMPVSAIPAAVAGVDFGTPDANFLDETAAASAADLAALQPPSELAAEFLQPAAVPAAIVVEAATPGSAEEPADAAELLAAAEAAAAAEAEAAAAAGDDADAFDSAIIASDAAGYSDELPVPPDVEPDQRQLAEVPPEVYENSAAAEKVRGEAVFVVDSLPRPQDYEAPPAEAAVSAGPFAALLSAQMLIGDRPPDASSVISGEFIEGDRDLAEISDRFQAPDLQGESDEQAGDWVVAVHNKPPPVPGKRKAAAADVEISSSGMLLPRLELPPEQAETDAPTMAAKARPRATAKGARPAAAVKSRAKSAPVEPAEPRLFSRGTVAGLIAIVIICSLAGAGSGFWLALSRQKAAPISGPAKARLLLGQANRLLASGDVADAIPVLEQARDEDPTLAEVQRSLGTAYARLGREPESAKAYRFYVTLAPNAADATEIRTMLARHLGEEQPAPSPAPPPPPPSSPPGP